VWFLSDGREFPLALARGHRHQSTQIYASSYAAPGIRAEQLQQVNAYQAQHDMWSYHGGVSDWPVESKQELLAMKTALHVATVVLKCAVNDSNAKSRRAFANKQQAAAVFQRASSQAWAIPSSTYCAVHTPTLCVSPSRCAGHPAAKDHKQYGCMFIGTYNGSSTGSSIGPTCNKAALERLVRAGCMCLRTIGDAHDLRCNRLTVGQQYADQRTTHHNTVHGIVSQSFAAHGHVTNCAQSVA
jgi:hypothetical protein